jgi:hypothetical protein
MANAQLVSQRGGARVQDSALHHCTVVDKRSTEKTTTIVSDNGKVYTSREEASTAMKTVKVC